MGLFDIFKKKPVKAAAPVDNDFNPLDINSVLNYIKKKKPGITDAEAARIFSEIAKPDKDQKHLKPNGELPYGWRYLNRDFIEKTENEYRYFSSECFSSKNKDTKKQYGALKSYVAYVESIQKLCAQKGECFAKWASDYLIFPDEVKEATEKLEYMTEHMDELLQREKMLKKLKKDLLAIIEAEPGVIQEKLYKRFDPELKNDISHILYGLWSEGIIRRDKSGRSYALYIN